MNYTSGPWEITTCTEEDDLGIEITFVSGIISPSGREIVIGEFGGDRDTQFSNANLMASAPELLEALKKIAIFSRSGPLKQVEIGPIARSAIERATNNRHAKDEMAGICPNCGSGNSHEENAYTNRLQCGD